METSRHSYPPFAARNSDIWWVECSKLSKLFDPSIGHALCFGVSVYSRHIPLVDLRLSDGAQRQRLSVSILRFDADAILEDVTVVTCYLADASFTRCDAVVGIANMVNSATVVLRTTAS